MGDKNSSRLGPAKSLVDTNNDPDLNSMLDGIRDAGMAVTNAWRDLWRTSVKYAWGQQLQQKKLKEEWEYIVVNRIYPLMFQTIAKLAGNDPKIITHAWDDEDEGTTQYADQWAMHLDYLWKSPYELDMRPKLIKGLLDAAVFGYMVAETFWEVKPKNGWDDSNKKWIGKPGARFVHPASFWCDPSTDSLDTAENCGIKRRVKMEWAQNKWPQYKKEIEAQAFNQESDEYAAGGNIIVRDQRDNNLSVSENKKRRSFSYMPDLILGTGGGIEDRLSSDLTPSDQKYVNIEKIFWLDYSERNIKIKDNIPKERLVAEGVIVEEETTGLILDSQTLDTLKDWPTETTAEYKEPLYPNGRFVLRVGNTILNLKKEDQVYKGSKWPFIIMPYHILPHMWQGGNATEMSRNNNDVLNMTISSMVNQARRTADPTTLIESEALVRGRDGKTRRQKDSITGIGRIILMARGKLDKIRRFEYPDMDPAVGNLAAVIKKDIDDQMFMPDVARGVSTQGQQTKAEIVRLNANSLDYTGLQAIFLDKFIDDMMTNVAEIAQQNYDIGRLMNLFDDGQKRTQKIDQALLDVRFDVNIEAGSTLPFDEAAKQQKYLAVYQLLENPVPNPMIEDVMRIMDISKRKEILARYEGLTLFRQFMAMGQQLAAALQGAQDQSGDNPEAAQQQAQIQAVMQQLSQIPGMQELIQLMLQAGQLAPAANV